MMVIRLSAVLFAALATLAAANFGSTDATAGGVEVKCELLPVPSAIAIFSRYRSARICAPVVIDDDEHGNKLPLHLFAHADLGGSVMALAYNRILEQIAARGFVVAAYLGCAIDSFCNNGEASFLEMFKTVAALKNSSEWSSRIDWKSLYSMSGHSTGARSVLQVAALRDSPQYMSASPLAKYLTPAVRAEIAHVGAVVSNHPDDMLDASLNPDCNDFAISKTPMLIITGSNDRIEPTGSAWGDFEKISSPDRVYVDVRGADHSEPIESHRLGNFTALFSRLFALDDESAAQFIFGSGVGSIRSSIPIAASGERNVGVNGTSGFVACSTSKAYPNTPPSFRC